VAVAVAVGAQVAAEALRRANHPDAPAPGPRLRSRAPAQTLAAARALMPALGISRVTDVTRLDRLGLPVWAGVRPRGRTLRVHAGKGLRPADAQAGALMEALEFAVAEAASADGADTRLRTRAWLAQLPGGLQLADFCPLLGVRKAPACLATVRCEDLAAGLPVMLPAARVLVPWKDDDDMQLYPWSSNGLASGNTLAEATLHGLLEVLERDTLAMDTARQASVLVQAGTLPPPWPAWQARWQRRGVELIVRHVPNEFGLPCFQAVLHEAASTDVNLSVGSGLHLDRGTALARAITEAAQARLSILHGGRDDITHFYAKYAGAQAAGRLLAEERLLATLHDARGALAWADTPHRRCPSPATALRVVLERLRQRGFAHVFRRRMLPRHAGLRHAGLHVVKVVVPRCEALQHPAMSVGPRLMNALLQRHG